MLSKREEQCGRNKRVRTGILDVALRKIGQEGIDDGSASGKNRCKQSTKAPLDGMVST